MMRTFKLAAFALVATIAGLLVSNEAEALMDKHDCTFCHSLHGGATPGGSTSFVPQNSPTNIEVLCLGCHFNPVDGSQDPYNSDTDGIAVAAVQPHRSDGGVANFHVTCNDCHEIHDNMPNWLDGLVDGAHDAGQPGTPGINQKMIGTRDPDGTTPYGVIRTREKDFDRNGIPDRGTVTQTCDTAVINDCYTQERRYVVFEHADPVTEVHAWAENTGTLQDPATEVGGPGPSDPTVIRTNESDSGALVGGTNNWSAYDSICGMCHTQTANHNLLTGSGLAHNDTRACTDCHVHATCFDRASCTPVPQTPTRDLQVDLVVAAPASVNSGDTVTITIDVTNLGNRYEGFDVRYISDIDGFLGLSRAEVDANPNFPDTPGRTSQTFLDWVTTTAGVHTITAEIDPVIYETVIANNSATAAGTVTVLGLDTHDVAVTAVTAPSPILQDDTVTVSVDIANPGTFTETFGVTLVSSIDGTIQTLSSGVLAPSGITTLDFSWNTTGATLGTHTLTATAAHDGADGGTDSNAGNDSASTTSTVSLPTHDVAVDSVTAPASTTEGNIAAVDVVVSNPGTFTETFEVTLSSGLDGTIGLPITSGALAPGGSTTLNFSWDTAGATIDTHTLTATAAHDGGDGGTDANTGNDSASTTSNVSAPVHDVAVDSVTAPASTTEGNIAAVDVVVSNPGDFTETLNVVLYDNTDDPGHAAPIQTLPATALGAGTSTTLNFSWDTTGASIAIHTLEAVAATVTGETITANNSATTTSEVVSAEFHDVAVISVTPASDPFNIGNGPSTLNISVVVRNEGTFSETFDVKLTYSGAAAVTIGTQTPTLDPSTETTLVFPWSVRNSDPGVGTYDLTATATHDNADGGTDNNAVNDTVTYSGLVLN